MVLSPNCAKIKSVASKQNSPKGNAAEKLSRISRYHEFKNASKKDLKKIARRPKSSKRSKGPRDPSCLNFQEVQVAKNSLKRSKLSRLPKVLDVKNPRASLRDPCYPSY